MHTDPATAEDRAAAIAEIRERFAAVDGIPFREAFSHWHLDDVRTLLSELEAAQARLDTIEKLHQPTTIPERRDLVCTGKHGAWQHWPCAEARALGLGEEGDEA